MLTNSHIGTHQVPTPANSANRGTISIPQLQFQAIPSKPSISPPSSMSDSTTTSTHDTYPLPFSTQFYGYGPPADQQQFMQMAPMPMTTPYFSQGYPHPAYQTVLPSINLQSANFSSQQTHMPPPNPPAISSSAPSFGSFPATPPSWNQPSVGFFLPPPRVCKEEKPEEDTKLFPSSDSSMPKLVPSPLPPVYCKTGTPPLLQPKREESPATTSIEIPQHMFSYSQPSPFGAAASIRPLGVGSSFQPSFGTATGTPSPFQQTTPQTMVNNNFHQDGQTQLQNSVERVPFPFTGSTTTTGNPTSNSIPGMMSSQFPSTFPSAFSFASASTPSSVHHPPPPQPPGFGSNSSASTPISRDEFSTRDKGLIPTSPSGLVFAPAPVTTTTTPQTTKRKTTGKRSQKKSGGSKPAYNFTCDVCQRRFTTKFNRDRHKIIHDGVRPHKCGECGKAYRRSDHLKHHQRKTHGMDVPKRRRG